MVLELSSTVPRGRVRGHVVMLMWDVNVVRRVVQTVRFLKVRESVVIVDLSATRDNLRPTGGGRVVRLEVFVIQEAFAVTWVVLYDRLIEFLRVLVLILVRPLWTVQGGSGRGFEGVSSLTTILLCRFVVRPRIFFFYFLCRAALLLDQLFNFTPSILEPYFYLSNK